MTIKISSALRHQVLERVDIVELINHRVKLKKAGGDNYTACCPFHQEKTPSFTVSRKKQFYHCFGCQNHGNAIDFLMNYDRIAYPDAMEALAALAGVEIPEDDTTPQHRANKVGEKLLSQVAQYYHEQLKTHPQAEQYLLNRGLDQNIIDRYQIGYAPNQWDAVLQHLGRDSETKEQLLSAGMLIKGERGVYDRFRDRIMFPIRNLRGQVIGFGGRIIDQGTPKYLNSPETPLFYKGNELYGLYEALHATKKLERIVVVEGYLDVIALAQFNIPYAAATLGTAMTTKHLQKLFRQSSEIICCFDGDHAGQAAAWRTLGLVLPLMRDGLSVRFMILPGKEDPDSLVRSIGTEAFEASLNNALPLTDFLLQHLQSQIDVKSIEGKAKLAHQAMELFKPMPDGVYKQLLINRLSDLIKVNSNKLTEMTETRPVATEQEKLPAKLRSSPVTRAIGLILHNPSLVQQIKVPERLPNMDVPGLATLQRILDIIRDNPNITTGILMSYLTKDPRLLKLATEEVPLDEAGTLAELEGTLTKVMSMNDENQIKSLMLKATQNGLSPAEKQHLKQLIEQSKI